MAHSRISRFRAFSFLLYLLLAVAPVRAAIQFDVFLGYDRVVPEGRWFPVVFEVKSNEPTFRGYIEFSSSGFSASQVRRLAIELPTGTLKRVVLPVFASSRGLSWTAKLVDESGRKRAPEQANLRPVRSVASQIPMIAAITEKPGGVPQFPNIKINQPDLQPAASRLQVSTFPDHPLTLEGLDVLYLSASRVAELRVAQANAIVAWVRGGGHLVVGIDSVTDANAHPWLRELLPMDLTTSVTIEVSDQLENWIRDGVAPATPTVASAAAATEVTKTNTLSTRRRPAPNRPIPQLNTPAALDPNPLSTLLPDLNFRGKMVVARGELKKATSILSVGDVPLVVQGNVSRGVVTLLTFNPEQAPFVGWSNKDWFWSKLCNIDNNLYRMREFNQYSQPLDGVFGAMLDSKQVHKPPLGLLLLLLVVYLLVIGPVDQYVLKRMKRQMLTWITFPCYVIFFSALIYYIGFRLRAGDSELNELSIVDVIPRGQDSVLRGRTWSSIYSPVNTSFPIAVEQGYGAFRTEYSANFGSTEELGRANILQTGNGFSAEVMVPVWSSRLYVTEWLQPGATPMELKVVRADRNLRIDVRNRSKAAWTNAIVVVGERFYSLGAVPSMADKSFTFTIQQGQLLREVVTAHATGFQMAVQQRRNNFGDARAGQLENSLEINTAISFISHALLPDEQKFLSPAGLDLVPLLRREHAVLLAWAADIALTKPFNRFEPRRLNRATVLRLAQPIE